MTNIQLQKIVVAAAICLFLIKIGAWSITQSVAILTDALEGIVNVISGFIGWFSLALSAKPKDENHPYGHGKVEFLSAAVEGLFMLFAGVFILYKGVQTFFYPQTLQQLDLGLLLIALTAVINFALGKWCVQKGKKTHSLALEASGKHLQTDTYTTIGILVGLTLITLTQWIWLDSAIAVLLGLYILWAAYQILRKAIAGIMDEADEKLIERVVAVLNANRQENWIDIHNLRIIKYGDVLHIDAHLTVPWYLNVLEAHQEVEALQQLALQNNRPIELFIHTDGCINTSCPICPKKACLHRQQAFQQQIIWTVPNLVKNQRHQSFLSVVSF
jgi:cation diffusion facilitator family transporter